jgi:hypothetical protein
MIIFSSVICLFGGNVVGGDQEFQAVMTEAKPLPPDKRVLFLERIEAVVRLRHCDVQTAINEAKAGLKHNEAAQWLFACRLT